MRSPPVRDYVASLRRAGFASRRRVSDWRILVVTRIDGAALRVARGQNDSMERVIAVSRDTVGSTGLYSSIVSMAPGGRTEVHHHGDCETSIYVLSGHARFYSGKGLRDVV